MKYLASILALVAAVSLAPNADAQFTVGGPGGDIPPLPGSGGGGNRCDTLPVEFSSFPAVAPVPLDAHSITSVELIGLSHTWVGDVQAVLLDPAGNRYNLISRLNTNTTLCTGAGDSSDFGGDYRIVGKCDPGGDLLAEAGNGTGGYVLASGDYHQFYGVWVDGAAGVANRDLSGIEPIPGIWTLEVYDGAGGDTGALVEWRMNGTTGGPTTYAATGGPIPAMETTGGGDRCTMLPLDFNSFPLPMPVTGGDCIESITLTGLSHTWVGDTQVVLWDPSGTTGYNIMGRINGGAGCGGFGDSSDYGGDYTIVAPGTPGALDMLATAGGLGGADVIPGGTYEQYFDVWVDGSAGVFNTPIDEIPVSPGIWTLTVYDGATGDTGDLVRWAMSVSSKATNVCDGELNSTGAAAAFSVSGSTSIAANDMTMHVDNLPLNSFGFWIVGNECNNVPMLGGSLGTLCVGGDLRRGVGNAIVNSGATGSVSLLLDMLNIPTTGIPNPSGVPAYPGQRLFIQYWYRDVNMGVVGSNLSNALLVIPTI